MSISEFLKTAWYMHMYAHVFVDALAQGSKKSMLGVIFYLPLFSFLERELPTGPISVGLARQ